MHILITGATGFIGQRLIERLGETHDITVMSRSTVNDIERSHIRQIQGSFDQPETLQKLDGKTIDAVIHLAAVTGGSNEEDAFAVNVAGMRRLYRCLLDRGCRKFITASSIAAAGVLDPSFVPVELPIPDDHPCLATDAYGLSKAMAEEVTRYFHRAKPDTDFINIRLGAVVPDEDFEPPIINTATELSVPYVELGRV
ncbi:NAD-dependent epimerase/dehydratase family protein [Paenibacillus gorillae]|uniref:NAD-dependent epimerase/dehydratase family protein n=1 Tax=Paenibacillus gorillae TaxID=1243662 RepID=UPI0004B8C435|nr:NAD(P)-dependent oxidoreductase [Paenibacillus gorillae]